jgi:hypothetical protein
MYVGYLFIREGNASEPLYTADTYMSRDHNSAMRTTYNKLNIAIERVRKILRRVYIMHADVLYDRTITESLDAL